MNASRPSGVSVACPAKVNLFLRIVAREDSGYHQIETMLQAIGLFDRVDARLGGEGIALEVRQGDTTAGVGDIAAELGDPENNTVVRAARAFFAATGVEAAVSFVLTKAIPAGTGLGGGSSDAAGTLLALNALHGEPLLPARLIDLGGTIGADVPFFCAGTSTVFAWGRGDRLMACPPPPAAAVVVVIPRARIATEGAYRELSGQLELPAAPVLLTGLDSSDWTAIANLQGNDFERVAFATLPVLGEVQAALADAGAALARLTGSGSAVFGIFADPERARVAAGQVGAMEGIAAAMAVPTLPAMPRAARIRAGAQRTADMQDPGGQG